MTYLVASFNQGGTVNDSDTAKAQARLSLMPPKTPKQLREEVEKANEQPAEEGHDYTAEGKKVPRPERKDFLSNLEKVSKPEK